MSNHRLVFLAALVAVSLGAPALAQQSGRIEGTVTDATGAPLPGATVTAIDQAGGAEKSTTSTDGGRYSLELPAGTYTVTVSFRGLGDETRSDLRVAAGGALSADFTMETRFEESVTVTARKREESLQDVPFSVAAPTEEMLRARGVQNMEDLAANVGGFAVQNLGPGQSQVAIRGVSAGQIVRDQPGVKEQVGVYLDESVISLSLFTPEVDLFDVSRVEVLRGPQGTLFGSGSLSGTVRYITNQPRIGETSGVLEMTGGGMTGGDFDGSAKLSANLPMGDTAAFRVAGYYNRLGGYMDAVQPNLSVNENVNSGDRSGVRASLRIAPSDRFSIAPRVLYQKVNGDGWNRHDAYNILANPYTTTRPAVTLGERELFTQIPEPTTDEFLLADVAINGDLGDVDLTAVTSYVDRDVLVVRDAGALTSSITGGSIGLPSNVYTLDAPLNDATKAKSWTQELRFSGAASKFQWVVGGFYSHTKRDYGQKLVVSGFEAVSGIPTCGAGPCVYAPKDNLFWSDLHYKLDQFAAFGEGTWYLSDRFGLTGGLRYYHFSEDKEQVFDGIFGADDNGQPQSQPGSTSADGVAPRVILTYQASDSTDLNAQVSKGFRLGGINDPLNVTLCTPADLVTFGGRESWQDETAWNYEVGAKSRIMNGRGTFNVAAFYIDIRDLQATVTAGSCSSRVIFNVPKARSAGAEVEFSAAPNEHFDFSISASANSSELRSTLTSTAADGNVSVVAGIEEGNRLPTVPEFKLAASATYQGQLSTGTLGYLTATFQHVGSRFTQIGDQAAGFGSVNLNSFAPNTIGGPLTASTFTFDPELPSYDLLNLRVGIIKDKWEAAVFVNNVTDEVALLALDQERGTRARVGYLVNPPRSFGATLRLKF